MIKELPLKNLMLIYFIFLLQVVNASTFDKYLDGESLLPSNIIMANGTVGGSGNEVCGDVFLDPGGAGNYSNGATLTMTILPDVTGDGVCLDFTLFQLDYNVLGSSEISFYDGVSASTANLIMTATEDWNVNASGTAFDFDGPGMVCANGPITIKWNPDDSDVGWSANISCFEPLTSSIPVCDITAQGTSSSTTSDVLYINSGDQVDLSAVGNLLNVPLSVNFNDGTIGSGWVNSVVPDFTNPGCVGGSSDGTTFMWMGTNPSPRNLTSSDFDTSGGGVISFDIKFAEQYGGNPCEGPDLVDEGVYLQYSINGGTSWQTIHYFFPSFYTDGSSHLQNWKNYVFKIPQSAETAATSFRLTQQDISSSSTDHWGLDNIVIGLENPTSISWDQGLGLGSNHTVNPTSNTTYTATITDATGYSCEKSVYVIIGSPAPSTIDFDGTDDYISRPDILSEATNATMMTWVKLDSGFDGGDIMGQGNYRMFVDGSNRLKTSITSLPNLPTGSQNFILKLHNTNSCSADWTKFSRSGYVRFRKKSDNSIIGTYYKNSGCPETYNLTLDIGEDYIIEFDNHHSTEITHQGFELLDVSNTVIFPSGGGLQIHPGPAKTTSTYDFTPGGSSIPITLITSNLDGTLLSNEKWVHVAAVYDGAAGEVKNYVNGELKWTDTGVGSHLVQDLKSFEIGRNSDTEDNYFEGSIYETRVYDIALTENQIQEQVYQRIKNIGGKVHGEVIPKDIDDGSLNWSNLVAYYKMNAAAVNLISDTSLLSVPAQLNNMTTVQDTNAPLPYVASVNAGDGKWTNPLTWEYGGVWDIPSKDWAIVQVSNNAKLITTESRTLLGNIVDSGSEFSIETDKSLTITNYLKLDGHLDLVGESQLIQTMGSTFDPLSLGYLERDQQGKSNIYSYNYWSSPVYPITSVINNSLYSVSNILKSGINSETPQNIIFTSTGYDGSTSGEIMTIADYWIWKYTSQPDAYANWEHVRSTGEIKVGEGFTMKGTGATTQNYIFTGKPNNGDINHTIGADHLYLLGNPYPSSLDANKFILDNINDISDLNGDSSIDGALYFYEHFPSNSSHYLVEYEGGYSTYNLLGGVAAISLPEYNTSGNGTIRPGQFIPVGQGFMVNASSSGGIIKFSNSQRYFKTETNTSPTSGSDHSIFTRSSLNDNNVNNENISPNLVKQLYFNITSPLGYKRELLLGIKQDLLDGFNYGYDAKVQTNYNTDCTWLLSNNDKDENLVIQGISSIYNDLKLPLFVKSDLEGDFKFQLDSLPNFDSSVKVFLLDKELGLSLPLEPGVPVEFYLQSGEYKNRFYIVFKVDKLTVELSEPEITDLLHNNFIVFYNAINKSIDLSNESLFSAKNIIIHNVLGQQVLKVKEEFENVNLISLPVSLSKGTYIVTFNHDKENILTKKLIVR
jgi:hypothetical protein